AWQGSVCCEQFCREPGKRKLGAQSDKRLHTVCRLQVLFAMRAPCTTSYFWLFMMTVYLVLSFHNCTAAAGRTASSSGSKAASSRKRARPGSSIKPPPAGETANPLSGQVKEAKSAYHQESFPVCRNVSVGYYNLFGKGAGPEHGAPGTSRAQRLNIPGMLSSASKGSCETKRRLKIQHFETKMSKAFGTRVPWCWASDKFSIVQRRASSVGCDTSLTLGCHLSASLCQCTFNWIIPEQMNETRFEMRHHRKKYFNGGNNEPTSVCDMQRFPATLSFILHEKIRTLDDLSGRHSRPTEAETRKRSWPLFDWHSVPNEAFILGQSFPCPERPASDSKKGILPVREKPARQSWKKVIAEVCLCPNNRGNGERQCSHKELICETISLAQVIDNLRRGGGELFDVYVEKFPQLKNYVAPISGTAIANDQVQRQDWERMLPTAASNLAKGLTFDLNLPAPEDDEDGHEL
ncbi:hypothetical protein BCR37DRAFT_404726, partial [Protomyces lactucae-debilis]